MSRVRRTGFGLAGILWFVIVTGVSSVASIRILVQSSGEVLVPSVVGKPLIEARALASQRKLTVQVTGEQFSDTVAPGAVIHQTINEGEEVKEGRSVGVILSRGPRERTATRVIDLDQETGMNILRSSNLDGHISATACSDGRESGTILAQSPPPGEPLLGRRVDLLVAGGPCADRWIMPAVESKPLAEAQRLLEQGGLQIRTLQYEERTDLPEDTVLREIPPAGTILRTFDPITLVVAGRESRALASAAGAEWKAAYVSVSATPGLFRHDALLILNRGGWPFSYAIDFLLTPGQNPAFALWVPPGAEISLEVEGEERWRKSY